VVLEYFGYKFDIPVSAKGPLAPSINSIIALGVAIVLALICTYYAMKRRSPYIAVVIGAAAFGLFIEFFDITMFNTYYYDPSYFMLFGKVPLTIVLCWGAIIYSAMRTSDYLDLKWYYKPIYDGMLALSIDLALDPVAVNLPLWVWQVNPQMHMPANFLGIPLANFYGWYAVVFCYSLLVRAGFRFYPERWRGGWTAAIVSVVAAPCAFVLFMIFLMTYYAMLTFAHWPESLILSILFGLNFFLVGIYLPAADHDDKPDLVSFVTPVMLHAFVMFSYYFGGLYKESNAAGEPSQTEGLIIFLPAIGVVSLIGFAWPFLDKLKQYFGHVKKITEGLDGRLHYIEPRSASTDPVEPIERVKLELAQHDQSGK
jgi:hypothetical protein